MSRVKTCLKTLPWREKVGKANFFIETIFIAAKLRKKLETPKRITWFFIEKAKKAKYWRKRSMSVLFFSKKCQGAYQKIIFHFHIFHDNDVLHCVWDKFLGEGIVIIYNYIFILEWFSFFIYLGYSLSWKMWKWKMKFVSFPVKGWLSQSRV